MGNVLVEESSLTAIANAIRTKEGEQAGGTMTPAQMPTRIANLPSGGISPVESVTINNKAALASITMSSSGTYSDYLLDVTVSPNDAPQMTQVTLSNPSVALVKDNGNGTHSLRVLGGGTTTVTVTDYSGTVSDSFTMTVTVPIVSFKLVNNNVECETGSTRQLEIAFTPSYTTQKGITWSSNSQEITVDQNGLVTAAAGATTAATITATSDTLGTSVTATVHPVTYVDNPDWASIKTAVAAGQQPYGIGSELAVKWKQYTATSTYTERTLHLVVMDYGTVEDSNGNQKPGMYLQTKETLPDNTSFENETRVKATEQTAQAGVYYYGNTGSTYTALNLEVGDPVPYELYTNVYKSGIDFSKSIASITQNGLGWWAGSWLRQWLNSESDAQGFGWTAHHISDVNNGSSRYGGFLRGFDADFINALTPIKITTARNNVVWSQEIDTTYDRIFLPSKEQVYMVRETGVAAGAEGTAWEYYVSQSGLSSPSDSNMACRVKKEVGTTTARYWWLRSAYRSYAGNEWNSITSGGAGNGGANSSNSMRVAPACVIC